ncbi:EamA/RhaT family transporter, partial [Rhizobium ruizarguesonis]
EAITVRCRPACLRFCFDILMALGAAFFYALAALAAKWMKGTPPHLIALIQVATGMLMLAPMKEFSHPPGDVGSWAIL